MNPFQKLVARIKSSGGLPDQDYVIASAEAMRDANPRSFSIPRSEQRRNLRVGDSAKIVLEARHPSGPVTAERPWVVVTEVIEGGYRVKIDNFLALFPSLDGATLSVGPEHIIAVNLPDEFVLPFAQACLASEGVVADAAWPHHLERVAPRDESDSGWRVYGPGEALDDAVQAVPCGQLIGQYQVLDSVMDEPALGRWAWDGSANEYRRDTD
jgi:hypothetical protein